MAILDSNGKPYDADANVIWQPLAGTSQEFAISSPADETLYCGTRGCGKTDVQVMKYGRNVGIGYGEYYRGIIFDRQYKNLDDIVSRTKRWFYKIWGNDAKWYSNKADYKWVWKTGEELLIRAMENEDDYDDYHGQEYPFIGWNELTKYPTPACYEAMLSCNRTSFDPKTDAKGGAVLNDLPLEVFSTTNPFGVGRKWVHKRFINSTPYCKLQTHTQVIFDPREQVEREFTSTRVAIFGHYKENTKLPAKYIATLGSMTNKNKRAAWLQGRWDVAGGGTFEECWDEDVHIVNNFTVPENWEIFPTFDWGSTAPFWVGWWALTNGEECFIPDGRGGGRIHTFPKDSLILINEWYGADDNGKGLKLGATAVAVGMKARVKEMYDNLYIHPKSIISVGNADGQIFNKINDDDPTIAEWFEKEGIEWDRADKSKGSRVQGLALMQERMLSSMQNNGRPALYIMRRNADFIETVPTLPPDPKNPDDVDTEAEDHAYDGARYAVLRARLNISTDLRELAS